MHACFSSTFPKASNVDAICVINWLPLNVQEESGLQLSSVAMAKCSILLLYFFQGILPLVSGQQRTAGPWRHRIQWENNGQVYSLLSTGSEYQHPVRSRSQSQVYVSRRRDGARSQTPGANRGGRGESEHDVGVGSVTPGHDGRQLALGASLRPFEDTAGFPGARRVSANASAAASFTRSPGRRAGRVETRLEPGPGAPHQPVQAVPDAGSGTRQHSQLVDQPLSGLASHLDSGDVPAAPSPALTSDDANEPTSNAENMVNDDPRNPSKNHRNSIFYNMYPTRGRSVARARRPPGSGYGTIYFQNGRISSNDTG